MSDHDWTTEITPTARAAISREIKAQWDGRELGGPLVGRTDGDRIVVTHANGIGTLMVYAWLVESQRAELRDDLDAALR